MRLRRCSEPCFGAYGPATPELFDKVWLSRGNARKALLRSWFAALEDELARSTWRGSGG